jgi:cytoskeleton protein RodZ
VDSSAGETLRRQREALGLSVSEVANSLKLNPRQVEALESGRFDQLPGTAFTRGFLRNYARLLKIDPAPLLAGLQASVTSETVELSPASNAQGDMPQVGRGRFRRSVIPGVLAALALFGIVVAGWYYDTQRKKVADELIASAPAPAEEAASTPPAGGVPAAEGDTGKAPEVTPAAADPAAGQTTQTAVPLPVPVKVEEPAPAPAAVAGGKDRLVFDFAQDAWIEVKDKNGKVVVTKLGKAGSREEFEVAPPMAVVIGNARSVKLERNGQPVDFGLTGKMTIARLKFE